MSPDSSCLRFCLLVTMMPLLLLNPQQADGQGIGRGLGGGTGRIDGTLKFMPVPYLNYDRSLGFMFGAVPLVMFNPVKKDTVSPSSLLGGVGIYTSNKTWFAMGFGMFHFDRDNWRVTSAGGTGTMHYQFFLDFLSGIWIPYQAEATFAMVRVERRIYQNLYGGISYVHAGIVTTLENLPVVDTLGLDGIGLNLSMDGRENPYYPRGGHFSEIKFTGFPEWFGNENISQKFELEHDHYFPVRKNLDVVATRMFIGIGLGEISFNQQIIVGGKDIRGYTQGAFRGKSLVALQGEYRWNIHPRLGVVGFAGIATVLGALNDEDSGKLLPGGGGGFRFRVFPETNFSVGIDVAAGINDWGIYFQIGEAF